MRAPAVIRDSTSRTHGCISKSRCELFDQLEILRGFEAASTRHDDCRFGEIEFATAAFSCLDHFHTCGSWINRWLNGFDAAGFRILGRRNHVRPHRDESGCIAYRDCGDDLPDVHRVADHNRVAFDLERKHIGDEADPETRCHARREVASLRRCAEDCSAIAGRFDTISGGRCRDFRTVVGKSRVLGHDDDIGAVLSDLRRPC